MEKIAFTDGTKICILEKNGNKCERESGFILNYKENARRILANTAWKRNGSGASLRGEYEFSNAYDGEESPAFLNGVTFTDKENTLAYSFTVGQSSGIYYKDFSREREDETHFIHSNSEEFLSLSCDKKEGNMLATMRKNGDVCTCPVLFTPGGDYNGLTDCDSKDENPSFSPTDGKILFNSAGVGRNERGEFVSYGNSGVYRLDPLTLELENLKEDKNFSYVKPKRDTKGNLYAIKRPVKEKSGVNPLLQILLIPVRIIEAIVGFVQFFVIMFAGKTLVSGKEGGNNPTKKREKTQSEIFVEGNRIQVDKELKRNARFQDKDYGFIPRSWQLMRLEKDGGETLLKQGVADYALGKEGVYCTDGKNIYLLLEEENATGKRDIKSKKITDTEFCLHLDVE